MTIRVSGTSLRIAYIGPWSLCLPSSRAISPDEGSCIRARQCSVYSLILRVRCLKTILEWRS